MSRLVPEGLAEEKSTFVVDLVPVFPVANIQTGPGVAGTFLMPQQDLEVWRARQEPVHDKNMSVCLPQVMLSPARIMEVFLMEVTLWLKGAVLEQ